MTKVNAGDLKKKKREKKEKKLILTLLKSWMGLCNDRPLVKHLDNLIQFGGGSASSLLYIIWQFIREYRVRCGRRRVFSPK
jgi:hypothetical protein